MRNRVPLEGLGEDVCLWIDGLFVRRHDVSVLLIVFLIAFYKHSHPSAIPPRFTVCDNTQGLLLSMDSFSREAILSVQERYSIFARTWTPKPAANGISAVDTNLPKVWRTCIVCRCFFFLFMEKDWWCAGRAAPAWGLFSGSRRPWRNTEQHQRKLHVSSVHAGI